MSEKEIPIFPYGEAAITAATKFVEVPGDNEAGEFHMWRGGVLKHVEIAYESWGQLGPKKDNAVLLFCGLSPTAHASSSEEDPQPGWWEFMVGPGKPIDTNRFYVVCVNSLGGCFGSTGPSSINPDTGKPYGASFPELTAEDIAKAGHYALRALGVERVCAAVGSSLGGMSSLAHAMQFPHELDYLVSISAAVHALPFTIAVRSLQREIIRSDPKWNGGDYTPETEPATGMKLARKLGLMSYRATEEWHQRFSRDKLAPEKRGQPPFGLEFEVEGYLDYNAKKFIGTFDPNSYLYISRSMDLFDVIEHGGSVEAGLARVRARRSLVIGVESDILFPINQQEELAAGLRKGGREVDFHRLSSINGHDSFLIDAEKFCPVVAEFFGKIVLA
ncbi:MAG: homoserine O-acetyltransferase MetX [Gammaproteobacteria bacterium]